jgi:exonuclease III
MKSTLSGKRSNRFGVVTWNVNSIRGAPALDALERLGRPDVLTLQEVGKGQIDRFRERLAAMGLHNVHYSGNSKTRSKAYGNVIASRWPLQAVHIRPTKKLRWPQLLGHAAITINGSLLHVITAHIPNGENNGWAKIDTFQALAPILRQSSARGPCVVTGDFNEPQTICLQDGRIVTWGQDQNSDGRFECWDRWTRDGRSGTGEEWDTPVRWLFENQKDHGLRHAFWDLSGKVMMKETHVSGGEARCFDHIFVSSHLRVETCRYIHEVRHKRFSDHSCSVSAQMAHRVS